MLLVSEMPYFPHRLHEKSSCRSEAKDKALTLNVCLKPSGSSAHLRGAKKIAYLNFGFTEPALPQKRRRVKWCRKVWKVRSSPAWR